MNNSGKVSKQSLNVMEHQGLVNMVSLRYMEIFSKHGFDLEDMTQIGNIGLIKARNTFDEEKGYKFSTYASRCIRNELLMALRKARMPWLKIDEDGNKVTYTPKSLNENLSDEDGRVSERINFIPSKSSIDVDKIQLNLCINRLPIKLRKIIHLRYCEGTDQREIADSLGMSQSYVSRLEKEAIGLLKRYMAC